MDMSLKKGMPMDLLKGSQEPLGIGTSHFENHCPREGWAKNRAESQFLYTREPYRLLKY